MRILHCCLAAFYIDNFSYQENILPRMHQLQGHDVAIVASTETYIGTDLGYLQPSSYKTKEGIPVTRIPYVQWLPNFVAKKLRIYKGLSQVIEGFNPEIIFLHDCQFISIREVIAYAKSHPTVKIYIDGHTDFINSGRNWISKNILHKIIYKWCAQAVEPYTRKFYGVLPIRVDFFRSIYKIPFKKVELLPLGADLTLIDFKKRDIIKHEIREELNINEDDLVFITGGKMDVRKNIHLLLRAVNEIKLEGVKLIVFGVPTKELKEDIEKLSDSPYIRYIGWLPSEKTYNYLLAADMAIFPGTHSVLWEQAVGLGLPCIFKRWKGIQHIDLNGNCIFFESDEVSEIKEKILSICRNKDVLFKMKGIAEEQGIKQFSYFEIAKRAIEE